MLTVSVGAYTMRCRQMLMHGLVQVAEVTVKGPRYWEQTISAGQDGGGAGALAALYSSGALPVQLQRWALSYVQDPSGVRGLLSQAFDEVRCNWAQPGSSGNRGHCCKHLQDDDWVTHEGSA